MSDEKNNDQGIYQRPERRAGERRSGQDRREMIRFEPDNQNRRSREDRRKINRDIWENRDF